jgi:hypothetical protein
VGERQRPETEIRGRIGNSAEAELDCVDALLNNDFAEFLFMLTLAMVSMTSLTLDIDRVALALIVVCLCSPTM